MLHAIAEYLDLGRGFSCFSLSYIFSTSPTTFCSIAPMMKYTGLEVMLLASGVNFFFIGRPKLPVFCSLADEESLAVHRNGHDICVTPQQPSPGNRIAF